MAITETLALADKVSGPALKMALATERLDAATGAASKALAKASLAGGKFGKETSKAVAEVERAKRALMKLQPKPVKAVQPKPVKAVQPKPVKATAKALAAVAKASSSAQKEAKKLGGPDALGAFGLGGAIGSGIMTGVAAVQALVSMVGKAVTVAKDLAVSFAEGVVEAHLLRSQGKALWDTLSGGRGEEVLARIKTQSISTGQSFDELGKSVRAARESGISFKDAFEFGKIRGDIMASGRSAEEADAILNKTYADIKSGATTAGKAMGKLTEEWSKGERGAKAVEKSSGTLGGALDRLKKAGANIFDELAAKAGPKLDELGKKISGLVSKFEDGDAVGMIDQIANGIGMIIDVAMIAAELVGPFWEGLKVGLEPLGNAIDKVGEALNKAFGGDKESNMDALKSAANMLGQALGYVVGHVAALAAIFGVLIAVGAAVMAVPAAIGVALGKLGVAAWKAGSDLINGLVNGIKNGIGKAVAAAQELADKVKSVVKSALKIGSPSKVFAELGKFTAVGLGKGIESGTPSAASAASDMASATTSAAAGAMSSAGPAARSGGASMNLTINVTAGPGATQADGEAMASGLVPVIRREVAAFIEGQLLEAGA